MAGFLEDVAVRVLTAVIGERRANAFLVNKLVGRTRTRPHPWSAKHSYISWSGLTDKAYYARLLPAHDMDGAHAPEEPEDLDALVDLFLADDSGQRECPKSTCLFPAFAQYLTDGFLRTQLSNDDNHTNRKRTTSNHEIDLSTLYGRTEAQTQVLRHDGEIDGKKGRLKSQKRNGEEWSPFLFDAAAT